MGSPRLMTLAMCRGPVRSSCAVPKTWRGQRGDWKAPTLPKCGPYSIQHPSSSPSKRCQLFYGMQLGRYDIECLQETHHSSDAEAQHWLQAGSGPGSAWLKHAHWCHYTTASCGVAILFAANIPWTALRRVGPDPSSRVLRVDFTFHGFPSPSPPSTPPAQPPSAPNSSASCTATSRPQQAAGSSLAAISSAL